MTETDLQLLGRYTQDHAEAAFAEIVRRHLGLVHTAALRQVRYPQLAEEVAQSTFTDLARNAGRLKADTILAAWLYEVAHRTAIDVVRRESRRQLRERIAIEMHAMNSTTADWTHIEPLLDEAMHALDETDRAAVLLRYFENKPLREVGQSLGTSDDAAQKRVSRAVERLREYFASKGVAVGSESLAVALSGNAVHAAPTAQALTISGYALQAALAPIIPSLAMTTLTKSLIATSTISLTVAVYQGVQANRLKDEVRQLGTQTTELMAKAEDLTQERDNAARRAAAVNEDLIRANMKLGDLTMLRAEVDRMRREAASQKAQPSSKPPNASRTAAHPPGTYITKDQLSHVGYATPEAAMESLMWAALNGTYEQINEALNPEALAEELKNPKAKEAFEERRQEITTRIKGAQILAKKPLAEDRVELKYKTDFESATSQAEPKKPELSVQPFVKVGNEWKIGGSTRRYTPDWENGATIETFIP